MAEKMISKEDFQKSLKAWGDSAKMEMQRIISAKTHGEGTLKKIKVSVKESDKTNSHSVGFNFARYGVFVAYGVGRGWVRQGDRVVPGSRVKKGSDLEAQMKNKGYSKKEIKSYVVKSDGGKARVPIDWFDAVLSKRMEELGEIAQSYYGDSSMGKVLEMMNRMTIKKKI